MNFRSLLLLCCSLLASCDPALTPTTPVAKNEAALLPEPPNAADTSVAWARAVLPILYGRRARNHDEVKVIADMVTSAGRDTTARILLNSPEFRAHWSTVLLDMLEFDRIESSKVNAACFTPTLVTRADGSVGPYDEDRLAAFVRGTVDPRTAFSTANLTIADVARSSIVADDLFPLFRAGLFAVNAQSISGMCIGPAEMARDHADDFTKTFLNRELVCSGCHRADWSITGRKIDLLAATARAIPNSYESGSVFSFSADRDQVVDWQRTFTSRGWMEQAVWGNAINTQSRADLEAFFSISQRSDAGTAAFGLAPSCGQYDLSRSTSGGTFGTTAASPTLAGIDRLLLDGRNGITPGGTRYAGLRLTPSPLAAMCTAPSGACRAATSDVGTPGNEARLANLQAVMTTHCGPCHQRGRERALLDLNPGAFPSGAIRRAASNGTLLVNPDDVSASEIAQRLSSGSMPPGDPGGPGSPSREVLAAFNAWAGGLPSRAGCEVCSTLSSSANVVARADQSLAYLVAQGAVNRIYAEVMGDKLSVAHGLSRNQAQRDTLVELTEVALFRSRRWSLKEVLARLLASNDFARRVVATGASTAYDMPMTTNPWAQKDLRSGRWTSMDLDPSLPANFSGYNNGVGDRLIAYRAQTVLGSLYAAMGWRDASGVLTPARFPPRLPSDAELETLRALGLRLNAQQAGGRGSSLQALTQYESRVFSCTRPARAAAGTDYIDFLSARGLTGREAARGLRDRLLSDGELSAGEVTALQSAPFFGPSFDLAGTASSQAAALRKYCAALVMSPQFLLQGFESDVQGARPPALTTAFRDEPVDYRATCERYRPFVPAATTLLDCSTTPLTLGESPFIRWDRLCPRGSCVFQRLPEINFCPQCPVEVRFPPQGFDPRESQFSLGLDPGDGVALWYGAGANVNKASRVSRLSATGQAFKGLQAGDQLMEGDLISIEAGAEFEFSLGKDVSMSPKGGVPKHSEGLSYFMQITGPSYVKKLDIGADALTAAPAAFSSKLDRGSPSPNDMPSVEPLRVDFVGMLEGLVLDSQEKLSLSMVPDGKAPFVTTWTAWSYKIDGVNLAQSVMTVGTGLSAQVALTSLGLDPGCSSKQPVEVFVRGTLVDATERVAERTMKLRVTCK